MNEKTTSSTMCKEQIERTPSVERGSSIVDGLEYNNKNLDRLCDAINFLESRLSDILLDPCPQDLLGEGKDREMSQVGRTLSSVNIEIENQVERLIAISQRIDL